MTHSHQNALTTPSHLKVDHAHNHFAMSADASRPLRVLLGATGSVAAVKTRALAERLTHSGAIVKLVPTHNALHFISDTATINAEVVTDDAEWDVSTGPRGDMLNMPTDTA